MPIITALLIWLGLAVFFIFLVRLTEHTYNICVFAFSLGKFILDLITSHASLINLSKVETLRSVVLQGRRRSNPIPDSKYPQCFFFSEHTVSPYQSWQVPTMVGSWALPLLWILCPWCLRMSSLYGGCKVSSWLKAFWIDICRWNIIS